MIKIRLEQPEDFLTIRELLKVCFGSQESDVEMNEWILVERISEPEDYIQKFSLVAIVDYKIVG